MKWILRLALVCAALFLWSCSDDTVGSAANNKGNNTNGQTNNVRCIDADGDGYSADLTCETSEWDCDDTDPNVRPGVEDTCFDMVDNNCSGDVDEECPQCPEGQTAPCGSDEGACQAGERTCRDGEWSQCEGEVGPQPEVCNGIDDNCNGETDENPERLCLDELVCNGEEMCVDGQCEAGEPVDCEAMNGTCTKGECSEKDGQCAVVYVEFGTPCDDGNFCTVAGTCQTGECVGEARDCGGETDQCNVGLCDEDADACVKRPVSDGTGCDDGAFCTTGDVCAAGVCGGAARDCSGLANQCNAGICDETADACVAQPQPDGLACEDGLYCTVGDTCMAGACGSGGPRLCGVSGGSCRTGVCDETTNACTGDPVADGTTCDDGQFCTLSDACVAGTCVGAVPRPCPGSSCQDGVCDDVANTCLTTPKLDGTACADNAFCTVSESCVAGACVGTPRDCSNASDACNVGVCNEIVDSCVGQAKSDGTTCDDGLFCTVNNVCQTGTCLSQPRNCVTVADQCNLGTCNEGNDACEPTPRPNGTSCSDLQYCTQGDTCTNGTCAGSPRDCSNSGDQCSNGVCDDVMNSCVATPKTNGTSCDDSQFCTQNDACQSGVCTGAPVSCMGSGDQCNAGFCDDVANACSSAPLANGSGCTDGLYCTQNDQCQSGSCTGSPRDCSSVGDQCNNGTCNETADSCVPTPKVNGSPCEDGQFCTDGDFCVGGTCASGGALDCSGSAGLCEVALCNDFLDQCIVSPDPVCCDVNMDQDFDGSNECDDCDDTNGAVYPGAPERCNGVDDDCDGAIDEDFDQDLDTYSVCSTDPAVYDCDDTRATVNPGAPEACGPSGNGNGLDDNCNGYIDEGCGSCNAVDTDGDGVSECNGDCDPNDSAVAPGLPESCDGKDNDCNTYTTPNCGVSQACNQDGDGDYDNDPDVCGDEMICACLLQGRNCNGNYRCTSFCNSSETGPIGDGCQADQTCALDLLYSANIHGCQVNTDAPGTLGGGEYCSGDSDCRSLQCDKPCVGQGCNNRICYDLCTYDEACGTGAVCRLAKTSTNLDGRCWPSIGPFLGSAAVGATCTTDTACNRGLCTTDPNNASRYCTEGCCKDSDCPSSYTCSLSATSVEANVVFTPPGAPSCTSSAQCGGQGDYCFNGKCGWRIVETSGQCIKDVTGQLNRPAGAACSQNSQCASNFCEDDLGICIATCCADSDCLTGQECVLQFVQTSATRATQARVCMSISSDDLLEFK